MKDLTPSEETTRTYETKKFNLYYSYDGTKLKRVSIKDKSSLGDWFTVQGENVEDLIDVLQSTWVKETSK